MTHYSFEQWKKYASDEIDEKSRERYEKHLYSCDLCVEVYFQVVSELENELPALSNEDSFTDIIMEKIEESKSATRIHAGKKVPFYQRAIFHYTLAAAMTLLLTTTGVFQSISTYVENVQSPIAQEKKSSVTEGIVDRTFAWMDSIEKRNREENR
ncbi:hypothetical protein ACFYKX_12085 [Cytobacillus sp. FJAT-54145]|uniref:Group-specific protein n=1 Tax=Cytobacillus spartinae TaxID=3299023 RepID=A0ABW6KAT5_9BACI